MNASRFTPADVARLVGAAATVAGVHDLGGLPGGPIDRHEHDLTLYEKRVDALLMLMAGPKREIFRVDALRRAIEEYAQTEYDGLPYYNRWMKAIRNLLVEQEVLSEDEFLALAGRVSSDLHRIIRKNPSQTARLLRGVAGLPSREISKLAVLAEKRHQPSAPKKRSRSGAQKSL